MAYIPPKVVEQARQIDLLAYLQAFEPNELVRISPNCYTTRTHDSLKISNGKWMWWSRRIGGYNALDYLVKVKGISFLEAVEILTGRSANMSTLTASKPKVEAPKVLILPDKSASTKKIEEYLFGRGIDCAIIKYSISEGLIFESLPYHNIVFVGYDMEKKPRYAAFRATNSSRIMGDCSGSDKRYSFRIANGKNKELHLFECAIDLLSYATLEKLAGRDWQGNELVSLAGVYMPKQRIEESTMPMALSQFLSVTPSVRKIVLHLDNDAAGRGASKALQTILPKQYEVVDEPPTQGKDYNDFLCIQLGIYQNQIKESGKERQSLPPDKTHKYQENERFFHPESGTATVPIKPVVQEIER